MVRSGKLVFLLLLTAFLTSGCYTSFRMPPAAQRAVETQYRDMNEEGTADQYAGKIVLPEGARDSYNWNFYYNSAWWFNYYEYIPENRPSGGYSGNSDMITGPAGVSNPPRLSPAPPGPPAAPPHFTPQATNDGSNSSSDNPPANDIRRPIKKRDNSSSSGTATRGSSTNRDNNANSSSTARSSGRPSRR